ncbi:NUDIX domain-containing protein [Alicyclobacillus fastidiosus]|uniref:NUDIX domain-containing protein n=1 Tax=Alicyclobacillus fastidiosus TaxID=392011 RepID=A0ABY6ZF20_9BACL|nr:NUDIX domain-containing protein [Alicyclobacillus fastidiosus]WAH40754.1 NUDIX domain-containing protein [Alicyclobacillus fastidiosus]GMA62227.1 hypothetical protein GCM10025859_26670 [Alicyclobacillus fastidiosus]
MKGDVSSWPRAFGLHTNRNQCCERPHSVLIFPVLFHNLVWVHHPIRGWEVPGGKLEPGEEALGAVRREAYEEAGLELGAVFWIAEYQIVFEGQVVPKWVFVADVVDVRARPNTSEIDDVQVFHPVLDPTRARTRQNVSPIMKDIVYQRVWPTVERVLHTGSVSEACL